MADCDWALFLDLDGTLVDLALEPDAVGLDPATRTALARLAARLGGALAIVTGRPIATVDALLAPYLVDVAGLHGTERRRNGRLIVSPHAEDPALRDAVAMLGNLFGDSPGLLIEDKGAAVALHWRRAPAREADALIAMQALERRLGPAYRLQRGKAVAELVPAGAAKGDAISAYMAEPPYQGRRPIFIGDDLTDEHGFAVVDALGGVSIHVGAQETRAALRLPGPDAVRARIAAWADGAPIGFATEAA